MRKHGKLIIKFLLVMSLMLLFTHLSVYAAAVPISKEADEIFRRSGVISPPVGDTGQTIVQNVVLSGLRYVKMITVAVGILYITIMGYTLVTKGDKEEDVTKAKSGLIYSIVAFLMISMAEDFGKIFDMGTSSILSSPQQILNRARLFDRQIEIFVVFVKYVIGAFATLMVVRSGIKLITAGGNEEETTKHKKSILYSGGGLILIFVGDIFINKVFYKVDKNVYSGITGVHPQVDVKAGVEQIIGITNFVVGFAGPVAVLMLIIGAIMYITAHGEEEQMSKAKRLLVAAAVGMALIFGAFAIVSTVIGGRLEELGTITP